MKYLWLGPVVQLLVFFNSARSGYRISRAYASFFSSSSWCRDRLRLVTVILPGLLFLPFWLPTLQLFSGKGSFLKRKNLIQMDANSFFHHRLLFRRQQNSFDAAVESVASLPWSIEYTVELRWIEPLWNHENLFETAVLRASEDLLLVPHQEAWWR